MPRILGRVATKVNNTPGSTSCGISDCFQHGISRLETQGQLELPIHRLWVASVVLNYIACSDETGGDLAPPNETIYTESGSPLDPPPKTVPSETGEFEGQGPPDRMKCGFRALQRLNKGTLVSRLLRTGASPS